MNNASTVRVAYTENLYELRMGVESILSRCVNISVDILASNGKELIEKLEVADPLPDICIFDVTMPVMSGTEVQEILSKRWPEIRSLIFTAHESPMVVIKMISLGVKGYILKQSKANNELCDAVMAIYEKGVYHSAIAGYTVFSSIKHQMVKPPQFTENELAFLRLACKDLTYADIAQIMNVSLKSAEGYRYRLFNKLNIKSRAELKMHAIIAGILPTDISKPNQSF